MVKFTQTSLNLQYMYNYALTLQWTVVEHVKV